MNNYETQPIPAIYVIIFSSLGLFMIAFISICMWGCPHYQVYSQRMEGESQLAHAEYSKKVQVQDALGKLEAAKSLASAEVERAKGIAQANQIVGKSLEGNEAYLKWLWIESLKEKGNDIIYIPTEAGLPILEAGKRPGLHK